jgi:hypothetical protein
MGYAENSSALEFAMKPCLNHQRNQALMSMEVAIIIATLAVLFLFGILPALMATKKGAKNFRCCDNLKQIGIAHQLWVNDLNTQFSLLTVATNSMKSPAHNDSARVLWQARSNYLKTPAILVCPADRKRNAAASFASGLGNANISYFLNSSAITNPETVLAGDANLIVDGVPVQAVILNVWTNRRMGWTTERNHGIGILARGNLGMADGSMQGVTSNGLNRVFSASPATNRLAIP